jgi:broad specificity phosphatase PhoE
MKLYVARHAETNYNLDELCNDSPLVNVYLTPKGIEQGKTLANNLKDIPLDLIITSEFPRTKETARLVNEYHDAPTIQDKRINDVLTGFEGRPASEFRAARGSAEDRWTFRADGGESFEDEKQRTREFLENLKTRSEKTVLVVTHQAISRIIYALINNIPNEHVDDLSVENTHYIEYDI